MKASIHPTMYDLTVLCSCGNSFTSKSTKKEIHVEVCYKCHPFYTGEHRFLDTKGRVEKFQKKQEFAQKVKLTASNKKKSENKGEKQTKTLKELLQES